MRSVTGQPPIVQMMLLLPKRQANVPAPHPHPPPSICLFPSCTERTKLTMAAPTLTHISRLVRKCSALTIVSFLIAIITVSTLPEVSVALGFIAIAIDARST